MQNRPGSMASSVCMFLMSRKIPARRMNLFEPPLSYAMAYGFSCNLYVPESPIQPRKSLTNIQDHGYYGVVPVVIRNWVLLQPDRRFIISNIIVRR
jgi:hypothetical protein